MPTIKGPIHFKGGFNARKFLEKGGVKVKLPFEATGFRSSKIPAAADLSGIKFAKDAKILPKKEVEKEPKEVKKEAKESSKEEMTLDVLYKIKGIGRKTVEDIKRTFKSIAGLKKALKEDKVPLRDDIVEKLKKELK